MFDQYSYPMNAIWNHPCQEHPYDEIDPRSVESMQKVMLQPSPVRLHDHCRLQYWNLKTIGRSCPQNPLARLIPVDPQVGPQSTQVSRLTPHIYLRRGNPMNVGRGPVSSVHIWDQRMCVEMLGKDIDHCGTINFLRSFYAAGRLCRCRARWAFASAIPMAAIWTCCRHGCPANL